MIPMFLRLKVKDQDKWGINLFIPLIIIYLLLLPLLLLALPFVLIWILLPHNKVSFEVIPAVWSLFISARGTEIEVKDKNAEVILKLL